MPNDHLFDTTQPPLPSKNQSSKSILTLTVISHPNLERIGDICHLYGSEIHVSRVKPDFAPPQSLHGLPLADAYISRDPVIIQLKSSGSVLVKPGAKSALSINNIVQTEERQLTKGEIIRGVAFSLGERVVLLLHCSESFKKTARSHHGLVGFSDAICALRLDIDRVADLNTPVLLRGQSGTGKELVANAIHGAGSRGGPFVCVNMGAIPATLAASELFGAVKGTFTGSDRHQLGYFRSAQNGTLFLDEVGETPPEVQVLLLRALETGEVSPVGAQKAIPFQTRFLAATDANLERKMADDSFKTPLFHRLSGYEIQLPPLLERLEDFGRLFMFFARIELAAVGETHRLHQTFAHAEPWLPTKLMVHLLTCSWPGNVRQLRNVVRQLVIGCRGEQQLNLGRKTALTLHLDDSPLPAVAKRRKPAAVNGEEVVAAMSACKWDIKAAAQKLGISRGALYLLIDKNPDLRRASDLDKTTIVQALTDAGGVIEVAADELTISVRALRRRANELNLTLH